MAMPFSDEMAEKKEIEVFGDEQLLGAPRIDIHTDGSTAMDVHMSGAGVVVSDPNGGFRCKATPLGILDGSQAAEISAWNDALETVHQTVVQWSGSHGSRVPVNVVLWTDCKWAISELYLYVTGDPSPSQPKVGHHELLAETVRIGGLLEMLGVRVQICYEQRMSSRGAALADEAAYNGRLLLSRFAGTGRGRQPYYYFAPQ